MGKKSKRKPVHNSKHDDFVKLYRSDDDTDTVDMTTLERGNKKKRFFAVLLATVLLLSGVAAALGYVVFSKNRLSVDPGEVTMTITAADTVASGDELKLTLQYHNNSPVGISTGAIELVMPDGFYVVSSDPVPADGTHNHWDVSAIPAGAAGTITITGQVLGQVGQTKDFTALFTYTPMNFSSDFQTSASTSVTLGESIMQLNVSVPEQVRSGEELAYVFTITNRAALPLVNAKAVVDYPDGFTVTGAEPSASQSNHTWLFAQIDPDSVETVTVRGTMSAEADPEQEFVLQTGIQEANGFLNLQAEDRHTVQVINPELNLQLTAPASAQAGEEITYEITISNPSKVSIEDIVLQLAFSGGAVDAAKASLDKIKELQPGDETTLSYTTVVKDPLPETADDIVAALAVVSATVADSDAEFTDTAEATTSLQGTLTLTADGRYFADDLSRLGSGPLPPQVGETTTYLIRWTVTAGGGEMSDVDVQTTLPDGVTYAGSGDDRVTYDAATSTVRWTLRTVEAGSSKTASFSVTITPTASSVGKLVVLTNEAIATATDINSGEATQAQDKKITTNLANDPGADDDGVVVE